MNQIIRFFLLFSLLLGCHKGYVALWEDSQSSPSVVYPYPLYALPPADQNALEKGIVISSPEQFARLLEDYLS